MNARALWLLPVLGFAAGFAAGWRDAPRVAAISATPDRSNPTPTFAVAGSNTAAVFDSTASPRGGSASAAPTTLAEALKFPSVLHRRYALRQYYERLGPADFPRVLAELQNWHGMLDTLAIPLLFRSWVLVAPEEAIRRAGDLPDDDERTDLINASMRAWARKDPAAVRRFAETMPEPYRTTATAYVEELAVLQAPTQSPMEALPQLLAAPNTPENAGKIWKLFSDWARSDPAAAVQEAMKLDPGLRGTVLPGIVERWTRKDPDGTARWLAKLPTDDPLRDTLRLQYAGELASISPAAAAQFALDLPDSASRTQTLVNASSQWLTKDPEAAIAFITQQAQGAKVLEFEGFFRAWSQTEPERAARAFAAQLPAEREHDPKRPLLAWVLDPWLQKDPAAAGTFAVSELTPADRKEVLRSLAHTWCARDATAAGSWAAALPESEGKNRALLQVAYAWAQHDATQATAWLGKLPAGPAKDSAVDGFAETTFNIDPDGALAWLRTGPSGAQGLERLGRVWGWWAGDYPQAARDWLSSSTSLTPAERSALEQSAKPK